MGKEETEELIKRLGISQLIENKGAFARSEFFHSTWNNGILEWWNVVDPVFSGDVNSSLA
ncbi:MAG: hypothetical protein ABIN18_00560 [Pseudomonadota bacterium]